MRGLLCTVATWADLREIVASGRLSKLGRRPSDLDEYNAFKAQVADDWASLEDYTICRVFGVASVSDGRKLRASRPVASEPPRMVWRLNDFPYETPEDVRHFVVWCTRFELLTEANVLQYAFENCGRGYDLVCWINPGHLKSLPTIPHAHVFVRPGTGQCFFYDGT